MLEDVARARTCAMDWPEGQDCPRPVEYLWHPYRDRHPDDEAFLCGPHGEQVVPPGHADRLDRFRVDRKALVAFLARARRRACGLPVDGAPDHEYWEVPETTRGWKPRELDPDLLHTLEDLIPQAVNAGALVCPAGWDIALCCFDDTGRDSNDAWYQWKIGWCHAEDGVLRTLGFSLTGGALEDLTLIGQYDAAGTVAAASVICEAADYGSRLLDGFTGLLDGRRAGISNRILTGHAGGNPAR